MSNKIDIGKYIKQAFDKNSQNHQPGERVLVKIHQSLDKQKSAKKRSFLWSLLLVLLAGIALYFLNDFYRSVDNNNSTIEITPNTEFSDDETVDDFIGPKEITKKALDTKTSNQDDTFKYFSLVIDTTSQIQSIEKTEKVEPSIINNDYNINDFFKQKTVYHYYRASDSLKIKTTDKRVIDSILSIKEEKYLIEE